MAKVGDVPAWLLVVVVVGMAVAIGMEILSEVKLEIAATGNSTTNPTGHLINASIDDGVSAAGDVTGWLGIIIIVVMGGIIIRLLMKSFAGSD